MCQSSNDSRIVEPSKKREGLPVARSAGWWKDSKSDPCMSTPSCIHTHTFTHQACYWVGSRPSSLSPVSSECRHDSAVILGSQTNAKLAVAELGRFVYAGQLSDLVFILCFWFWFLLLIKCYEGPDGTCSNRERTYRY
ncbi:hypothetical protein BO99DRAFT_474405 [Aspergillus violaceofuscus CBS 115571]|uniref:Uncharacterized protein n=1 Tax=Aspergillus violaceofuscus (strain CBS 115571) TaxID=1450538 RepID=A0A2V5H2T7_ASPV1|nr:hypothetical protein BO99DRAFT_474405 [Aspergillus violaceofuscus CBS 115571]